MQKKILIVDENNEVRDLFHKSMSLLSYSLHYATDGFQAMHSYALHKHDLVILDITLPGNVSGLDVCKMIKHSKLHQTKIILLSGLTQREHVAYAVEAGADLYVNKPLNPTRMIKKIRQLLKTTPAMPATKTVAQNDKL